MRKKYPDCPGCGHEFDTEDGERPEDDGQCYSCCQDKNQTECCNCGEHEDNEHMGAIGSLIVWMGYRDDDEELPPGLYQVLEHPFYTQSIIGCGWLDRWAVEHVADLPADIDMNGFPAGMLCRVCSAALNPRNRFPADAMP